MPDTTLAVETPQAIVLPPRSRYSPTRAGIAPEDSPVLTEELKEPSRNGVRAMSPPAQMPRNAFVQQVPEGPEAYLPRREAPRRRQQRSINPGSRPSSAASRPNSAQSQPASVSYVPRAYGKPRPNSARATSASGGGGGGALTDSLPRPDVYALWTPGETVLRAPPMLASDSVSGRSTTTPRRPGAEELQYELSVTASVLRAAQDRLVKEREQRQLARVGEELAMVDVKRAREEAKALAEERRLEAQNLAKSMADQRKELESELTRLESEQEVRAPASTHTQWPSSIYFFSRLR